MDKQHLRKQIVKIARQTRKFVENSKELVGLMGKPAPHLGGWCAHSSIILSHNLREAGLDAKIVSGYGHWFVKCENFLVDITASQFGQSRVCVKDFDKIQEVVSSNKINAQWWKANVIGSPKAVQLEPTLYQMRTALKMPELWAEKCTNCGHKVV
jgi:hypothetical protein